MQSANPFGAELNFISETIVNAWQCFQNKNDDLAVSIVVECQQRFPDSQDLQETLTRLFISIQKRQEDSLMDFALEESKKIASKISVTPPPAPAAAKEAVKEEEKKEQPIVATISTEGRLILKLKRIRPVAVLESEKAAPLPKEKKRKKVAKKVADLWCRECKIKETPQWRFGPEGKRTLCNACGLRFASKKPAVAKEPDVESEQSLDLLAEVAISSLQKVVVRSDKIEALRAQPVPVRKSAKMASEALQKYYVEKEEAQAPDRDRTPTYSVDSDEESSDDSK